MLSKNCHPNRELRSIDGVVVHHFSCLYADEKMAYDTQRCIELFEDLNCDSTERKYGFHNLPENRVYASAHWLIGRAGETVLLIPDHMEAWHAGASIMNGRRYCNKFTVGVELVGSNRVGYTEDQYISLISLLKDLKKRYDIHDSFIMGHRDVSKGRKFDPSSDFDWHRIKGEL